MRRVVALLVAAGALAIAASGRAADQPISGAKLLLSASGGRERLVFISKDPAFLFPAIGGADDPGSGTPGGLRVELITPAEPLGVSLDVPAGSGNPGWEAVAGALPSHRFTNGAAPEGPSALKVVLLKQGRLLKLIGRSTGLPLTAPQGSVGVRITTGTLRSCARFDAATMRRDEPGRVVARAASSAGLADCSNTSLGGVEPVCGDGVQNQSSEQCDGSALFCPGGACRPAGYPGECTCCTNGGIFEHPSNCCNQPTIWIPSPDGGTCHAVRCDPPYSCSDTDVCQPDGSCCAPVGAACRALYLAGLGLGPCCPGLECGSIDASAFFAVCCVGGGGACSSDAECCTGHCTPGGMCEACRPGGATCGSLFECCSLSCSGGTCEACGASGAPCLSGASCCSGTCDQFTSNCE
jgi:hypothetical protein